MAFIEENCPVNFLVIIISKKQILNVFILLKHVLIFSCVEIDFLLKEN
jgi:hypothetical protein